MSEIITINNDVLEVEISTLGAEMISVKKHGENLMWNGDEKFFKGFSPLLFPYCSSLKDGKVIIEDKKSIDFIGVNESKTLYHSIEF